MSYSIPVIPVRAVCLSILVVCFASSANGQYKDSLLNVYNSSTIHPFGHVFIKGSRQLKFRDLQPELASPLTSELYKKSRADLRLTSLFTVTAVAALVTSVVIRKNHKGTAGVLSVAAIGLNLGALHFRKRSSELVDRAIWHRNKEILFGVRD